jgi:hypothetical protein
MNGIEVIVLIASIVIVSAGIGYYMNYGQPTLKSMEEDPKKDITTCRTQASLTQSAMELIKEIEKVTNVPTTQEESQQLAKDIVDVVTTPAKKKKKYYPKKK